MLLACLWRNNQNFWPLAAVFCLINLVHVIKNVYYLYIHRNSHRKIKFIFWVELQISLGYLIFFTGFLLVFTRLIKTDFLPLFAVPYLAVSLMLFFTDNDRNIFLAQKKFSIFEGVQLVVIAAKYSVPQLVNWNYALIFFMAGAIYLTVLGLLLTIILSCSLFGFLYRNLEGWKVRSLVWMTWYYLFTGLTLIYLIKGVIEFFDDENIITREQTDNYLVFHSANIEILQTAAFMLIFLNFVNMLMHVFWAEDIKKYLSKVIYKNELRKEISLRTLSKNFSFKVIQYSAVFFKKEELTHAQQELKNELARPLPNENEGEKSDPKKKDQLPEIKEEKECCNHEITTNAGSKIQEIDAKSFIESECIVCYDNPANIIMDPCGHGGLCKECALEYVKNEDKCMIGRQKIEKLYVIEYNKEQKCYFAKGEIKLKV